MDAEIQKQKKVFEQRKNCVGEIQTRIQKCRDDLQLLDICPLNHVNRSRLLLKIKNYESSLNEISSGRLEKTFFKKIEPFLEANKKLLFNDEKPKKQNRKRHKGITASENSTSKKIKFGHTATFIPGTVYDPLGTEESDALTKTEMLSEYLTLFEGNNSVQHIELDENCLLCGQSLVVVDHKAQATCTRCGFSKFYIDSTTANMQYNHELEFSSFSYKRVNHFNDWLAQIQARESTAVTDDVLDAIIRELLKRRVSAVSDITIPLVREILKKLKFI